MLTAALAAAGLLSSPAVAAAPVYDPELALLALTVQKASVPLLREEFARQAEWLGLSGARVAAEELGPSAARRIAAALTSETDVPKEFRDEFVRHSPSIGGEAEKLLEEVRRYHGLAPGGPLKPIPAPAGPKRALRFEEGPGVEAAADAARPLAVPEPVAFAERRFGSTGPFLRKRRWAIDFYLGPVSDLAQHYRGLGYRRFYRLRGPYIGYGKEAYVLAPEPDSGLRPRLVYCGFYGREFFRHTRTQWAVLARAAAAKGKAGPEVRTIWCDSCAWAPLGQARLKALLDTCPFQPAAAAMGYDYLFSEALESLLLGVYENEYWRVRFYDRRGGPFMTLEARHTAFGDIAGAAFHELARRGVASLYFAGPAAGVGGEVGGSKLYAPDSVALPSSETLTVRNALRARGSGSHQTVPSPLSANVDWLEAARARGIETVDCELAFVASGAMKAPVKTAPRLGLGVVITSLARLHPEEDRAVYSVGAERHEEQEVAKRRFRDLVLKDLGLSAEPVPAD